MNRSPSSQSPFRRSYDCYWLGTLVLLGFLVRIAVICTIPLFNDEAVYLLRALRFPAYFAQTLGDGKLIQEVLLAGVVRLPGDTLMLARAISVATGVATIAALGYAGHSLGAPRAGLVAAGCYTLAPISVLHDVLALPDSMLALASVLVVVMSVRFAIGSPIDRRIAVAVGAAISLALAAKLTGILLLSLPACALLVLSKTSERRVRLRLLPTVVLTILGVLAVLSLGHYGGAELHKTDFHTPTDRLVAFGHTLVIAGNTLAWYLPAPLFAVYVPVLQRKTSEYQIRVARWLLLSAVGYTLALLVVGTTIYPRYLLPIFPLLALAAGLCIDHTWREHSRWQRWITAIALVLAVGWNSFFAMRLYQNPLATPMVAADRQQYLATWTAGYNLELLYAWLRHRASQDGGIIVANHDQPRLIHMSTEIALRDDPMIRLTQVDLTTDDAVAQLDALARQGRVLLPLDDQERIAFDFERRFPRARLEQTYVNPLGTMRFYLYSYQ